MTIRILVHIFHFTVTINTYGVWLPVWWWYAAPKDKRQLPGAVISLFILIFALDAYSTQRQKHQWISKFEELSEQEKTLYKSLKSKHPTIPRADMLEAVKLPEVFRERYFQSNSN